MDSSSITAKILDSARAYILYIYYIILVLGCIGNTLNILVFTQLKLFRDNRWAFYLIIGSIVDIGYNVILFTSNILQIIYGKDPQGYVLVWCRMRSILFQSCTLISFFTVCFAACDQFFSTTYRLNMRQICTLKLARSFIFGSCCIWSVHSIIFSLFLYIVPPLGCSISNPIMTLYSSWFHYPVLYGPLPIVIASLFSLLAFRNVRRIVRHQVPIVRRRLDQQMTAMILTRVIFLVIFALPYSIYRVYAINIPMSQLSILQNSIKQLLQVFFPCWAGINFASSFYIFAFSSHRYRRQVKYLLVKKYWQRFKYWCCANHNQVVPTSIIFGSSEVQLE